MSDDQEFSAGVYGKPACVLLCRQHHYLDHSAGERLEGPTSRHVLLSVNQNFDTPRGDRASGSTLPKLREGTPDSAASVGSHIELLHI